jgi:sterol desaturase/sphingolipid hydroxylase (fatty acid hydroxylase superfamily)
MDALSFKPVLLIAMVALALIEWGWATHIARRSYDMRATLASVGVAIGQSLLKPISLAIILSVYAAAHSLAPFQLAMDDWRIWLIGFFALEFAYYWFHRWSHTINWLWATHAVHHSANELTLPAALRLGWTGLISGGWLVYIPLILIGFPPKMIGILLGINLLYQFGLHTEMVRRLGPIEWIFNTPSHHRAHHASEAPWLDCNFGGVLIIYDRIFGTFVPEPVEGGLSYGLTVQLESHNPLIIAFHQWQIMGKAFFAAPSWSMKAKTLFGRPDAFHERNAFRNIDQVALAKPCRIAHQPPNYLQE